MRILPVMAAAGALTLGLANIAVAQDQVPAADPNAPANPAMKSPNAMTSTPLAKGRNSFTKGEARDRIKKAGYTQVTGLMLDANGLWQASAQQNGQSVHVALDYKGDVAAR